MFESPRSLWQHFAVAIVTVLVIMSLSSVIANNENDQCMLSGKTRTEKPCTGRLYQLVSKVGLSNFLLCLILEPAANH